MVAIVRTNWDGTSGGPGLTQFALLGNGEFTQASAGAATAAVRKFWDALKGILPDELRLTVSPIVDIYNETNGELTGSMVSAVTPAIVTGFGTTGYAGGSGLKVNWNTGIIRGGRRVKGVTYIVPAIGSSFGSTGTPNSSVNSTVNVAAATLLSDLTAGGTALLVWSRPLVVNKVITRQGATSGVISGNLAPKSAILRGRRD